MSAMWSELSAHAEAGAVRGDALEKNLVSRIEHIESSVINMNTDMKRSDQSLEFKKSMEWMNWRISWLEWATSGESEALRGLLILRPCYHRHLHRQSLRLLFTTAHGGCGAVDSGPEN